MVRNPLDETLHEDDEVIDGSPPVPVFEVDRSMAPGGVVRLRFPEGSLHELDADGRGLKVTLPGRSVRRSKTIARPTRN